MYTISSREPNYSLRFYPDLRFRMRKVWREVTDMDPQECNNKLATYQSYFASPLLDL